MGENGFQMWIHATFYLRAILIKLVANLLFTASLTIPIKLVANPLFTASPAIPNKLVANPLFTASPAIPTTLVVNPFSLLALLSLLNL